MSDEAMLIEPTSPEPPASDEAPDETWHSAVDIRAALRRRWPDSEYITIDEAPDGPDRQGRKIDLLVLSLWRSRGHEIDAVEIKVSLSDWMREVNQAQKADFWWRHSHRFWVAVPASIALKVRQTLPSTWGLLVVGADGAKAAVKATKHDPEPLAWQHCLGIIRASANAGLSALQRAEHVGYDRGRRAGEVEAERKTGDSHLRDQLNELRSKVRAFTAASGIDISRCWNERNAVEIGALYKTVEQAMLQPDRTVAQLARTAQDLERVTQKVRDLGDAIQQATQEERGIQ